MESLVLSPKSTNQDLIPNLTAVSASPWNVTFSQSGVKFHEQQWWGNLTAPVFHQRKMILLETLKNVFLCLLGSTYQFYCLLGSFRPFHLYPNLPFCFSSCQSLKCPQFPLSSPFLPVFFFSSKWSQTLFLIPVLQLLPFQARMLLRSSFQPAR